MALQGYYADENITCDSLRQPGVLVVGWPRVRFAPKRVRRIWMALTLLARSLSTECVFGGSRLVRGVGTLP